MPVNLVKKYPNFLDLVHLDDYQRMDSLRKIFDRDIQNNESFIFNKKRIRPIKIDGISAMDTLFHHLTTHLEVGLNGVKTRRRLFEMDRSKRLHWLLAHINKSYPENIEVFSYMDRIKREDKVRTYVYDKLEQYVIVLEPQRSKTDYYLLTAYYLNEKRGKKQIKQKMKRKLPVLH